MHLYLRHWPFSSTAEQREPETSRGMQLLEGIPASAERQRDGWIASPATADLHVKDGK